MINLLPQYWKKDLREEEIFRIISIFGIVTVSALFCFIMMLFLMKNFFAAKAAAIEIAAAEKQQDTIIFDTRSAEKRINDNKKLIEKAGDFYKSQKKIAALFSRVTQSLPQGVVLKSFSYTAAKVSIRGFAPDRDSLVAFKNNLEAISDFKNPVFPAENWLQAENIDFSASFDLAGNNNP